MGLFRPYERTASGTDAKAGHLSELTPRTEKKRTGASAAPAPVVEEAPAVESADPRQPRKKATATPTRKQAEAERMARLHPNLSPKEQKRRNRQAKWQAREAVWQKTESSPERALARDYVDARWTITEFMFPGMILIMAVALATMTNPQVSVWIAVALWGFMIAGFINVWILWRGYKKLLAERVPGASTRGLLMYMFNRALMIRRFRRPGPRVERGAEI